MLAKYFERYGWEVFASDDGQWQTTFRGELALYPLYVRQADGFVFFSLVPFLLPPKLEAAQAFFAALLRWNRLLNWVKFSLEPDLSVSLSLEIPEPDLSYQRFAEALDLLRYVADGTYLELLNLSQNPQFEPQFRLPERSSHSA